MEDNCTYNLEKIRVVKY